MCKPRILGDIKFGKTSGAYSVGDGMYDYCAVTIAEKFGRFWDLSFSRGKNSLIRWVLTARGLGAG